MHLANKVWSIEAHSPTQLVELPRPLPIKQTTKEEDIMFAIQRAIVLFMASGESAPQHMNLSVLSRDQQSHQAASFFSETHTA